MTGASHALPAVEAPSVYRSLFTVSQGFCGKVGLTGAILFLEAEPPQLYLYIHMRELPTACPSDIDLYNAYPSEGCEWHRRRLNLCIFNNP